MNKKTEQLGLDAVVAYEEKNGRTATRVQKCGYDLLSKVNDKEMRHIEVKATTKQHFSPRWLEPLERQCAQTDDLFYLYLVTSVGVDGQLPRVFEYDRAKLEDRFVGELIKYNYQFPKSDFS